MCVVCAAVRVRIGRGGMHKGLLTGMLALLLTQMGMVSAAFGEDAGFTYGDQETSSGIDLKYRLFIPSEYDRNKIYPLVFALHGYGERGDDNEAQLSTLLARRWAQPEVQEMAPCFVYAPQCPADGNTRWADVDFSAGSYARQESTMQVHLKAALEVLDHLTGVYSIDLDRIYITGLSMGGYATWEVISRYPDKFAAAIPICGAGDPSCGPLLAHLPIWAFHGDADLSVPVSGTRDMIRAITAAGGSPHYTEYPGVGHDSWTPAMQEDFLPPWLFAQIRGVPDNHKSEKQ